MWAFEASFSAGCIVTPYLYGTTTPPNSEAESSDDGDVASSEDDKSGGFDDVGLSEAARPLFFLTLSFLILCAESTHLRLLPD